MPLVFVHGVNVRYEEETDKNVQLRNSLFKRYLLKELVTEPEKVKIFNPYWGQHGVKFAWNQASLPKSRIEELGPEDELPAIFLEQFLEDTAVDEETVLLQVARKSLRDAIDLLWLVGADGASEVEGEELAGLAVRAIDYAHHNPHPVWLEQAQNDQQFLRDFEQAVDAWQLQDGTLSEPVTAEWETLGSSEAWDRVKEGADRIKGAIARLPSPLLNRSRPWLHKLLTRFVGDVFVYLKERGTREEPGAIVKEIVESLEQAKTATQFEDDKVVVVAHSMGGNIMYDVLTYFRPDIQIDWLITVGSQVALFEEMKLFHVSDGSVPVNPQVDRVTKPENVAHWLNIFDYDDVLSFATEGIFQGVKDFSYSTGQGVGAHGGYFGMPSFHERLRVRIQEVGLLGS